MERHPELRKQLNDLIDRLVAEGRYRTGDEVIRAIEQLFAEREKKLAALQAAIDEGEASGPFEELDFDEFLARKNKEHQEKVSS